MINNNEIRKEKIIPVVYLLLGMIIIIISSCVSTQRKEDALINYSEAQIAYEKVVKDYNDSADNYNSKNQLIIDANAEMNKAIRAGEVASNAPGEPFDIRTRDSLNQALNDAKNRLISELPLKNHISYQEEPLPKHKGSKYINNRIRLLNEKTQLIIDETNTINKEAGDLPEPPDYSETINLIMSSAGEYLDSIDRLNQVTNPDESWVMNRLNNVKGITGIQAVTKDRDPNNQLGQEEGYVSCIYYSSDLINQSKFKGKDLIDKGTAAGGAIEIFKTAEDAKKRESYFNEFAGTLLNPGSYYVIGTVVIRTSLLLNEKQQEELTNRIALELLRLE